MLSGWKTLIFAVVTAVVGALQTFDWVNLLGTQKAGMVVMGIGLITGVLRYFTTTPIGEAAPK